MPPQRKFAQAEWERRFLLRSNPEDMHATRIRHIVDRYIDGTTLRLRYQRDSDGGAAYKLTQKLGEGASGAFQGLITTIYMTAEEYAVFASLPARQLAKTRYSVPPFGIDVFERELKGLTMAEAEFNSADEAAELRVPPFFIHDVSSDPRFTGARLARATRQELNEWLAEFGIKLNLA